MSDISIHAPVKGATLALDLVEELRPDFNPRSREGSDPVEPPCTRWPHHFNPRSREGSDDDINYVVITGGQFQSTLP